MPRQFTVPGRPPVPGALRGWHPASQAAQSYERENPGGNTEREGLPNEPEVAPRISAGNRPSPRATHQLRLRPGDRSAGPPRHDCTSLDVALAGGCEDQVAGRAGAGVEEGEEVGGSVEECEETGFVGLPAEEEFTVDNALVDRYGIPAERDPGRAGLRMVVAATALGPDGDGGDCVGGVAAEAERRTAGGEPGDHCIRQLNEQFDGYGVRAGEQPETVRGKQVGERREIHAEFL